jgi:uncharacterized lipoprotein NlpE involved in copper resistance
MNKVLVGMLVAVAALMGCERDSAKRAGDTVENAADKAGDAVDRGLDQAGAAANRAINSVNDAARQAADEAKEATDTARDAVGRAARESGEALNQAGQKTEDWVSPTTAPGSENETFRISAPALATDIKQGDRRTVTVSLHRGESFKRDVTLEVKAAKGISVEPTEVVVKGSDAPDVQLQIAAPVDAAIGEYRVHVKGTPATGEPTSVEFTVKVVAP